jgi:putative two-component system response regulator
MVINRRSVYSIRDSASVYIKDAMPHEKAMTINVEGAGKHFDTAVVNAFRQVHEQFRRIAEESRA